MTPEEREIYEGLLALVREELQVLNAMARWGLTDSQLDQAAASISSEIDHGFAYEWRPNRGPNYSRESN